MGMCMSANVFSAGMEGAGVVIWGRKGVTLRLDYRPQLQPKPDLHLFSNGEENSQNNFRADSSGEPWGFFLDDWMNGSDDGSRGAASNSLVQGNDRSTPRFVMRSPVKPLRGNTVQGR
ncbi:hypothetical protein DPEC_G00155360 [Dallia pectoralis]|uniref:Uncharacterized protein n=1 Tax=Dallia pectoralis TaxID=75939 RepID=A0ACC2GK27_DALPE|nr:hypothetical protein DPEC_G00155360 [Dallia pectoralis]